MLRIDQPWLTSDTSQAVCRALMADGAAAYFVGGCVRNAFLGEPVSDLDVSTDAHPKDVMELARRAGIKAIPTGIDHGTVTLVMNGVPFEVTTFRKDVSTNGRRAVVAFADNMVDDAKRRDFTMNALYADPGGQVFDPLGGFKDLQARRIRFIGTPEHRIKEDYLRTLRYFRFHAWYGDPEAGLDPDALAGIAENLDGLSRLSRERISHELLKLFAAPDPAPAVAAMRQSGVLQTLLPGTDDRGLAPLVHLEAGFWGNGEGPDPVLRLAVLGDAIEISQKLRLTKAQDRRLALLREVASGSADASELAYRHGVCDAKAACLLRAALLEMPLDRNLATALEIGANAVFPVTAHDLMPEYTGAALGDALKKLESAWIKSGFQLDRDALLQRLS